MKCQKSNFQTDQSTDVGDLSTLKSKSQRGKFTVTGDNEKLKILTSKEPGQLYSAFFYFLKYRLSK